jgi:hypothetical protein
LRQRETSCGKFLKGQSHQSHQSKRIHRGVFSAKCCFSDKPSHHAYRPCSVFRISYTISRLNILLSAFCSLSLCPCSPPSLQAKCPPNKHDWSVLLSFRQKDGLCTHTLIGSRAFVFPCRTRVHQQSCAAHFPHITRKHTPFPPSFSAVENPPETPERCIFAEDEPALSYFQRRLLVEWLASPETSDLMLDQMSEFRNPEHQIAIQQE